MRWLAKPNKMLGSGGRSHLLWGIACYTTSIIVQIPLSEFPNLHLMVTRAPVSTGLGLDLAVLFAITVVLVIIGARLYPRIIQ